MKITVDPAVVTHTLDDHCFGINQGVYYDSDLDNPYDRELFVDVGFEIFRTFTDSHPTSSSFYRKARDFHLHMQARLGGRYCAMLGTPIMPQPQPGGPAVALNPPISTAADRSLTAHQALYRDWIASGINVRYWQYVNEAALMSGDKEFDNQWGNGTPWFDTSNRTRKIANPSFTERLLCEDWVTLRHREVHNAYHATIGSFDTEVVAAATSGIPAENGFYNRNKAFLLGHLSTTGYSNPNQPPSNIPHLDVHTVHSYRHIDHTGAQITAQSYLNRTFWDGATSEADMLANHPGKGGLIAPLRWTRAVLDANGGTDVPIGIDESGSDRKVYPADLNNVAEAIAFCQHAGELNLRYLITHAWTRTATTSGDEQFLLANETQGPFTSTADAKPGRRYFACRDVWGKYMRLAKRQVKVTVDTAAGMTPATAQNNSVPRIQACAGLSADGKTLYLMYANVDLATSETLTVTVGEDTFTVNVPAGQFFLREIPVWANVPVPTPLDHAWDEWMKPKSPTGKVSQGAAWRRDNPGEWAKLAAYRDGGARPDLVTNTGRQMVYETDAWRQT